LAHVSLTVFLLPDWHEFLQELLVRYRLVQITMVRQPQEKHSAEELVLAVEDFMHVEV